MWIFTLRDRQAFQCIEAHNYLLFYFLLLNYFFRPSLNQLSCEFGNLRPQGLVWFEFKEFFFWDYYELGGLADALHIGCVSLIDFTDYLVFSVLVSHWFSFLVLHDDIFKANYSVCLYCTKKESFLNKPPVFLEEFVFLALGLFWVFKYFQRFWICKTRPFDPIAEGDSKFSFFYDINIACFSLLRVQVF